MRRLLLLTTAFLLPATLACTESRAQKVPKTTEVQPLRRDLMLIIVDDWALSDLYASRSDANGWNDLIHVDSLAAQGQSWNNFYVQTVCNQTRATMMFGVYRGTDTGTVCKAPTPETPSADLTTMAEVLSERGYSTAAFGKWHIGTNPEPGGRWQDTPAAFGFKDWRAWNASNLGGHCGSQSYWNWNRVDDGVAVQSSEYHTEAVANAACDWWQSTEGPKFAYVCLQSPHQPLHTPPANLLPTGYPTPTTSRERYEAMLVSIDTLLGNLRGVVDLNETIVALMGDNGTPPAAIRPGEQSANRVKKTTFEDGVNVPFIVVGPDIDRGETDALGHAVDMLATLADLAGADVPAGSATDSVSLAPVFADRAARVRDHVICDYVGPSLGPIPLRDTAVVMETPNGLIKGRWFKDTARRIDDLRFFELAVDPLETQPLDESDPLHEDAIAEIDVILRRYVRR